MALLPTPTLPRTPPAPPRPVGPASEPVLRHGSPPAQRVLPLRRPG